MNTAQFAAERARHPDALATEVITLRRKCRQLEQALHAQSVCAAFMPAQYAEAIEFAWSIAHSAAVTEHETPGRTHPASQEPGRNPAALGLLKAETHALRVRGTNLHTAASWAVDHPDPTARRTA